MDRAWPIISNRAVLRVNQRWAGDPGRRITLSPNGWQAWAKPMGAATYAVLLLNTATNPTGASLPLRNVSVAFAPDRAVCLRDLYTGKTLPSLLPGTPLEATLPVHDSGFYCAWPSNADGVCNGPAANDCP
jgi:hypothetical protein